MLLNWLSSAILRTMELPKYKKEPALTSVSGTLSFTNPLPKAPLAILHPRRIFVEIGLFSKFFKTEVSEYIASKSKGRKEVVKRCAGIV